MKVDKLSYVSLFMFFLGLFFLYYSSLQIEVRPIKIAEITNDLVGKSVIIEGNITFIKRSKSGIFMIIEDDSGKIFAPIFSNLAENLDRDVCNELSIGKEVRIKGYVDLYENSLEVIPSCKKCIEIID